MRTSVTQYLKGVASSGDRAKVRKAVREKWGTGVLSELNRSRREDLERAIFRVEDELESVGGGQSDHPRVVALRAARNLVLDDLGWNEKRVGVRASPAMVSAGCR